MALTDVSKMVTTRQRQCEFVEWFVRVYLEMLALILTEVFSIDLEEGQSPPDVLGLLNSLVRRLRRSLTGLIDAELTLVGSLKERIRLRGIRDTLTETLRTAFMDGRGLCRAAFSLAKSDEANFPRRIADEPLALLRQTLLVVRTASSQDFDLGEPKIEDLNPTRETLLGHFQSETEELRAVMDAIARQVSVAEGSQSEKNQMMKEFDTTFRLFVRIVDGAFRMAGKDDLAKRFRRMAYRRNTPQEAGLEPPADPSSIDPADSSTADSPSTGSLSTGSLSADSPPIELLLPGLPPKPGNND